jgi:hypothetical protein
MVEFFKKKTRDEKIMEKYEDTVKRYELKQLLSHPLSEVEIYIGFILWKQIPVERIYRRRDIEDFSHNALLSLEKGDEYREKVGDADYILEEPEKWDQIGGETRIQGYRDAIRNGGLVKVIVDEKPLRKSPDAHRIVRLLTDTGAEVRCKDDKLRAIQIKKKDVTKLCVWYSSTSDENTTYARSHDPEKSYYEGFIISLDPSTVKHKEFLEPIIESFDRCFIQMWEDAKDAKTLVEEIERQTGVNSKGEKNKQKLQQIYI